MNDGFLLLFFALSTLLAFVFVAMFRKRTTRRRRNDGTAIKSTLADI